jgi:hypothetical protein
MAIWGSGSPACCCQPAVAGGFIYAALWGEVNTHLAPQALFTQSSVQLPLLQAFPFPSTLGKVTLHPLSQASVFIYSSCGKWVFPPLLWSCPPTAIFTSFPALLGLCRRSCLLQPACCEGFPLPHFWRSGRPALFAACLFCCYCLLFRFFFSFFPGWGLVCPGGCADLAQGCLWEYRVPLSSPCGLHLPKPSGCCHLAAAREPSWFLRLMWSETVTHRLEVWRGQSFASSRWFFL